MELRQLRHFVALAEERSVTGTARHELIVQSGLSNAIQALERELGTETHLRGTRPLRSRHWGGPAGAGPRGVCAPPRPPVARCKTADVLVGWLRFGVSTPNCRLTRAGLRLGQDPPARPDGRGQRQLRPPPPGPARQFAQLIREFTHASDIA